MNIFFEKKGPFPLKDIIKKINYINKFEISKNQKIKGIENIFNAKEKDITFLSNIKYKKVSIKTKASACITSENLSQYLPKKCKKIIVNNVLLAVSIVSKIFYPNSDLDYPDFNLRTYENYKKYFKKVKFGKNVLVGKNVSIGSNTLIGSNTVIESNVKIGNNCVIGSFVVLKNSVLENNVCIQDGAKIGIKGFGFIPKKEKNIKTPHIGKVLIKNNVEIGAGCTIDRGSMNDTVIGNNTYLDNQVHVAHNVKMGKNCIIAGQVGFAGSTTLGDNVMIGGQAGISGHLKIGNNVSIGGGSGVIKNIKDNTKVMGYPAIPFKEFVKQMKTNEK